MGRLLVLWGVSNRISSSFQVKVEGLLMQLAPSCRLYAQRRLRLAVFGSSTRAA
ncbi:hypothetical protein HZF08_13655 [Paenibacillus sp. CGMCC 1.16610]|uniref:Uncharacterized protein n=1 Tax=Paenibacillus anseongense TaxID=2682845 RepID=A0ABW9U5E1_9BACL|nr:hypothetical protein [Paenibacillus anseongense]MBA2939356.1 hypothetical protein [Paenibacillus sp. CGMCC 1.16610]MVQ35314.1 hypothetical protein [Paenibacillus anseongense]